MKTIIYGGAFNPPTIAHQTILHACTELAETFDGEVWLLPSGDRVDKTISVPLETRFKYLEAMRMAELDASELIRIEETEIHRPFPVETYDTIQEFNISYPDREFYWVFGSDSTQTMGSWDHGSWIMENTNLVVVNRLGYAPNPLLKRPTFLNLTATDVSSTLVRQRFLAGEEYETLVIPTVHQLLKTLNPVY